MNRNFCNAKLSESFQDTPVSCKFRGSGCFFEDLVVNLDDHETSCMFRSVRYAILWILSPPQPSSFVSTVSVVDPDPVGSETLSRILKKSFRIRILAAPDPK
jgi:hypothetical protein